MITMTNTNNHVLTNGPAGIFYLVMYMFHLMILNDVEKRGILSRLWTADKHTLKTRNAINPIIYTGNYFSRIHK